MDDRELAYLGLGANVGTPQAALEEAIARIAALPRVTVERVSRLYRTRPVGPVAQDDFLNAAVAVRVPSGRPPEDGAMALLAALKQIERAMGRVERERWGPREVDLDILLFGGHRIQRERITGARSSDASRGGVQWLQVPHPHAMERLFVLAPLADLAADLEPPGWGMSVMEALECARDVEGDGAAVAIAGWNDASHRWVDS